jgi:hypothetical protein
LLEYNNPFFLCFPHGNWKTARHAAVAAGIDLKTAEKAGTGRRHGYMPMKAGIDTTSTKRFDQQAGTGPKVPLRHFV